MTLGSVASILEKTGLPVIYRAWPENEAPPLPFICYLVPGTDNFFADGETFAVINRVNVELYTKLKSPEAEVLVEKALSAIAWQKTETYISSERCYQILYEIEV